MDSLSQFLTTLLGSGSLSSGLFAVLIAYFGGVLSSLTPCIYPMIPITVSVVGGIGPGHASGAAQRPSWKHLLTRGSAYVLGMTLIYSLLGVVAGLTGKVFGTLTNTSGWYIGLGVIMSLAALTMMDVIPFDPQMWIEKIKFKMGGKRKAHVAHDAEMGFLGALTLGASSGFIAAPCTTPVLTVILAFIAKTQSVGLGLSLMIAFSLGLGTLLIVIATFAGAIQRLPRSGQWMKTIKVVSGFVLLAFAQYLIFKAGTLRGSY